MEVKSYRCPGPGLMMRVVDQFFSFRYLSFDENVFQYYRTLSLNDELYFEIHT